MKTPNLKKSLVPTSSLFIGAALIVTGCGSSATNPNVDTSGTTTQLAAQTVGGAVSSTNSDSVAANEMKQDTMFASLMRELSPIQNAFAGAFTPCPTIISSVPGCALSGDTFTLTFASQGCTYGGITGPIWQGGTVVTAAAIQSGVQCDGTYPVVDSVNTSLTRTYLGNLLATPTSATRANGDAGIVIDTSAPTATTFGAANSASPTAGTIGWNYSIPSGGGYERSYVSATDHNLSIAVRLVGYAGEAATGTVAFDHTLSTTNAAGENTPLNIVRTDVGTLDQKETVNGTLNLQHNLMKMTASAVFNNVKHEVGCCYPISGEIATTFNGGANNGLSESMQFSAATCALGTLGQVTFTDVNGTVSTKTLDRCF